MEPKEKFKAMPTHDLYGDFIDLNKLLNTLTSIYDSGNFRFDVQAELMGNNKQIRCGSCKIYLRNGVVDQRLAKVRGMIATMFRSFTNL
jgi:hypothetical protein